MRKIDALPNAPAFLLHTGDISHLSKPSEFDTVDQILRGGRTKDVHFVPGEHDVLGDDGAQYRERYGKGTKGDGWYSFDYNGAHFIGLVNVQNLKAGGLGQLGHEQLEWLEDDVKGKGSSTPIVVFAHIPLVDHLSGLGLGHRRFGAGAWLFEKIWQRFGFEWAYSSDRAEGRGERDVSYGDVHGVSAACAWDGGFARADDCAG